MNKYSFDEIKIGMKEEFSIGLSADKMESFCQLTGDTNPLHCDSVYASNQGFEDCVVYGMLTTSYLSTLVGIYLPGEKGLIQNVDINFIRPVYVDDLLAIKGEVIDKNELFKVIKIKVSIFNSKGEKVVRGKMQVGVID